MSLTDRLRAAEVEAASAVALHQRSLAATERARDAVIAAQARVALLQELLAESSDGG